MIEVSKKMTVEEVLVFLRLIGNAIQNNSPVKEALAKTLENVELVVLDFETSKAKLFSEYVVKDEDGKPSLKNPDLPATVDNLQLTNELEFHNRFSELLSEEKEITVIQVPNTRTVITSTGEYELGYYLEHATEVSTSVALFLNEYFIYE